MLTDLVYGVDAALLVLEHAQDLPVAGAGVVFVPPPLCQTQTETHRNTALGARVQTNTILAHSNSF